MINNEHLENDNKKEEQMLEVNLNNEQQQVDGHKKEERMLEMISLTTTTQELHNRGLNLENEEETSKKSIEQSFEAKQNRTDRHTIRVIFVGWSIGIILLFSSFILSATVMMLENSASERKARLVKDITDNVLEKLEIIKSNTESQASFIAEISKDLPNNATLAERRMILQSLSNVFHVNEKNRNGNPLENILAGYYTLNSNGMVTGVERAWNSYCPKNNTAMYFCWGTNPSNVPMKMDEIISTGCESECNLNNFPPTIFSSDEIDESYNGEIYTHDAKEAFIGVFNSKDSSNKNLITWIPSHEEEAAESHEFGVVYLGCSAKVIDPINGNVLRLGVVDLTFYNFDKILHTISNKSLPADVQYKSRKPHPIVLGVVEYLHKTQQIQIAATSIKGIKKTNVRTKNQIQLIKLIFSYGQRHFNKLTKKKPRPYQDCNTLDDVCINIQFISIYNLRRRYYSCKISKFSRKEFLNFSWFITTCVDNSVTVSTFENIKNQMLLLIVVFVLPIFGLTRFVIHCMFYKEKFFNHNYKKSVEGWKRNGIQILDIVKSFYKRYFLAPTFIAVLSAAIFTIVDIFFQDTIEIYHNNEFRFFIHFLLWGMGKFPTIWWIYLAWINEPLQHREKRWTDKTEKNIFFVCISIWLLVRTSLSSIDFYSRGHVLGIGKLNIYNKTIAIDNNKNGNNITNKALSSTTEIVGGTTNDVIYSILMYIHVLVAICIVALHYCRYRRNNTKKYLSSNKGIIVVQRLVILLTLFVTLFEIISYATINGKNKIDSSSYSSNISLYFIPVIGYTLFSLGIYVFKIYKDKEVTKSGDNESFYAKLTEYKVIIVMFFLYIFDWLSSLFAIIFVHLKFMLDQEESYFQKDVPTQACKHSCKHYASWIPKYSIIILSWCLFGALLADILYRISIKAAGRKLSMVLVIGFKMYRNVNNALLYILIEPYSTDFIVTTILELLFYVTMCTGLHIKIIAYVTYVLKSKKPTKLITDTSESKEKESLTLINRAVRGIYSMHTYTTSRLVMIVVLYMQGMLSKISKKDVSVFSNSGIRYNRNLYINGYIFQFMACILGTSLVRIYYSYRLRNFEFRTTTSKIRRKSKRRASLAENLFMYDSAKQAQQQKYTLANHMEKVYPSISRLIILFFIFGTLNPMMHFRSQTMHSRFIHKYIDVANNRNDMFIEWMKTSTTDWSVSRLPLSNNTTSSPILNYEQCVCLED